MLKRQVYIISVFLIGFSFFGNSQLTDSTSLNPFSDISIYKNVFDVHLSNVGQAKYSLLSPFNDNSRNLLTLLPSTGKTPFYTDVFFLTGTGREGVIEVSHHQPLSKTLYTNLNYVRSSNEGLYFNQKASVANFRGDLNFNGEKGRYGFKAKADFYTRKNELNGGVNDSVFKALYDSNASQALFPTLLDADLEKKYGEVDVTHFYNFSKDSLKDSQYFRISQSLNYYRERFDYVDGNTDFYSTSNIDTNGSNDSLKLIFLTHTLKASLERESYSVYAGLLSSYADYKADTVFIYSTIHSGLLGGKYKHNKLSIKSDNSYTFYGFLSGNFFTDNSFLYRDSSLLINDININLLARETTPMFYHSAYYSNRNNWDVPLNNERAFRLKVNANSFKYKTQISALIENRSSFLYFDSVFSPKQTTINFFQLGLKKQVNINSWLTWTPQLFYQSVSSTVGIELPQFIIHQRLYAEGNLFKKVIKFRAGIDVLYYTDYNLKNYNPSFDSFSVQDKIKGGNYPFIDVFAEFYLKSYLAFFVKSEHVTNGLHGPNYLAAVNYRQVDRTIKLGLKWRLFE